MTSFILKWKPRSSGPMDEHAGIEPTLPNFFITWEKERDRVDDF